MCFIGVREAVVVALSTRPFTALEAWGTVPKTRRVKSRIEKKAVYPVFRIYPPPRRPKEK